MKDETRRLSAQEALERLREGNRHFVSRLRGTDTSLSYAIPARLPSEQNPVAIVLGCSDSRVPAEIIFQQGLGDLFVIRVAGNIVAPSLIGSVEFAATQFGTRLVVVLGHSRCGAVMATVEELCQQSRTRSKNLSSIVDRIRPAVEGLMQSEFRSNPEKLVKEAVAANVRLSVQQLRHGSEIVEQLIQAEGLLIVGAEYSLETGTVHFFDDLSGSGRSQ